MFFYSYSILLAVMATYLFGRLALMSRRLLQIGSGVEKVAVFVTGQLPGTLVVWLWSSFLFGSTLGAVWSALLWLSS